MWVNANFKETQLTDVRIGQSVNIISDLYGENVVFHGRVTGINMGTGNAFSLLPAQNATGTGSKSFSVYRLKFLLIQRTHGTSLAYWFIDDSNY